MDAKPQRMSHAQANRVHRDENAPIHSHQAQIHRKNPSTATAFSSKSTNQSISNHLEVPAKRSVLADSSNIRAVPVTNNSSNKSGASEKQKESAMPGVHLGRPAVRQKATATVQTNASVATGTQGAQKSIGGRQVPAKKKPAIYRDEPQASQAGLKSASARVQGRHVGAYTTQNENLIKIPDEVLMRNGQMVDGLVDSDVEAVADLEENESNAGSDIEIDAQHDDFLPQDDQQDDLTNTMSKMSYRVFPKLNAQIERELAEAHAAFEGYVDEDELSDPMMVGEYMEEILEHLHEQEIKLLPDAHYMDNQADLQWSMRSILMDWVVQVHQRFRLLPETLFLAANLIDRFLSKKNVSLGKLQLVGTVALFIAAKYEEIVYPAICEMVYMVDHGYTEDEILKAERFMLSILDFQIGAPGPLNFLRRLSKADNYDLETRTLAKYLIEVTIMDERFVGTPASYIAASAVYLARIMLTKGEWTVAHIHYGGYTAEQLVEGVQVLVECCQKQASHHQAIFDKYSTKPHKRAARYVERWMTEQFDGY